MNQKELKNIFSLITKLDISFAVCLVLALCFYMATYSFDRIADDIFWVLLVLSMLITYYFLRQDVVIPLSTLGKVSQKLKLGNTNQLEEIKTDTPEFTEITDSFNKILFNIERAARFIQQIENGNLHAELEIKDNEIPDKLSQALLNMRNTMRKIELEERQRNWATQGVAMLSEILRTNNQDVKGLSRHIMAGLVPYLEAVQGSIFVLQETTEEAYHLKMMGMYAYDRQKFLKKDIRVGKKYAEDLIGQVFLERAALNIKKIPEGYLEITSGLGDAPPKNLLLVPLMVDENVYGVIEIASFHELEPYQVAFIERISESIALTIATVRINEQTKLLLEESQRQAEQLKAQEEEMRQNVEELAATQEEMARKNKELESANTKMTANAQILQKALQKAQQMQKEVAEKNEEMQAQEEELKQNLEELQAAQEELLRQKAAIEANNRRLESSGQVLQKSFKKAQEDQARLQEQKEQIEQQERLMRQTLEQLQNAQAEMLAHQKDLEEKTQKLQTNEVILKKFMDRANASDARHKATIREKEALIVELQQKLAQYESEK